MSGTSLNIKFGFPTKQFLFLAGLLLVSTGLTAQKSLKFENGGGPSGNGPSTSNQVITMYNGDAAVYSPTTKVTYSFSNQQYASGSVEGTNLPGMVFGATVNGAGSGNAPLANALYPLMNSISGSTNAHYSIDGATPAINVGNDYSVEIMTISDALINSNGSNKIPTSSKDVYYGDLTLTFDRPVNNPVVHFTGMGGFFQENGSAGTLGLSSGFELTDAYTVTRLSGNNYFSVSGKKITNSAPTYNSTTSNSAPAASSGSVKITGNNITSLTFKVYMNGDGQGSSRWSSTSKFNGDALLISASLTTYNISGNVFNDANGMNDNTVNGTGTNAGGLNAVLIDPATGNVVAVVPVNSNGTYSFTNVLSADYSIAITKDNPVVGSAFPGVVLPDGWAATGENLGTGNGSDGTADGILTGISLNSNLTNANFGIEQQPVSDNKEETIPIPTNHTIPQGTLTTGVSGSDAEDGTLGNSNTIVITELPANGTMYYNGTAVTAGQQISGFDPALLSFENLQDGTRETSFKYSFLDAAGKQSQTPGTYTVKWDGALSVMFTGVSAFISGNQLTVNWNTEMENNNAYFEVLASTDGKTFKTIATVQSKAPNGSSDTQLSYSITKGLEDTTKIFGVSFLFAFAVLVSLNRKRKLTAATFLIAVASLITVSCSKQEQPEIETGKTIFVRIVQVDKDGTRSTSKTVQAVIK